MAGNPAPHRSLWLVHQTNPRDGDSDNDGLVDGAEVNTHHSDPKDGDSTRGAPTDAHRPTTHFGMPEPVYGPFSGLGPLGPLKLAQCLKYAILAPPKEEGAPLFFSFSPCSPRFSVFFLFRDPSLAHFDPSLFPPLLLGCISGPPPRTTTACPTPPSPSSRVCVGPHHPKTVEANIEHHGPSPE